MATATIEKTRVAWIDTARVLAILLVMQAHTTFCFLFNHYSEGGAVATFFLISGYFATNSKISAIFMRLGRLIPFYILWSLYGFVVANHGFHFSIPELANVLLHGSCAGMWFILYLMYCTVAGAIALRLPRVLRWLVCLGLFAWGIGQWYAQSFIHPCMNCPIALAVYLLGQLGNSISLSHWRNRLFPHHSTWLRFTPTYVLCGILVLSAYDVSAIPAWLLIFVSAWAILGTAIAIHSTFTATGQKLAFIGKAVVFIYAIHMPTLRMMTSAYLRFCGELPPYAVSAAFIFFVTAGALAVYALVRGKSRIADVLLFAR